MYVPSRKDISFPSSESWGWPSASAVFQVSAYSSCFQSLLGPASGSLFLASLEGSGSLFLASLEGSGSLFLASLRGLWLPLPGVTRRFWLSLPGVT